MGSILITGGAGFVGSNVAKRLVQSGQSVVIVDNFDPYYDPAIKRANVAPLADNSLVMLIEADVRDGARMDEIVAAHNVKRILHLAAMPGVRYSIERTPLYVEVNVNGAVNILEAARKHDVELVVCASTSSVYGQSTPVPFVETATADRPLAAYPATKRASELIGHGYFNMFGLNQTYLRFFNVYGPNGRPDMMPMKVLDAIVNDKEITLYNGGNMQRDWTYIDDVVDGVIAALERPLGYEVMNLGFGQTVYMTEFIEIMEELTGKKAIIKDVPAPASEPYITYCDNSLAREKLGFNPQTPLHDGLAAIWQWYVGTQSGK